MSGGFLAFLKNGVSFVVLNRRRPGGEGAMRFTWFRLLAVLIVSLIATSTARSDPNPLLRGTSKVSGAPGQPRAILDLGLIGPSMTFRNAQFGTGGVGLRNRGAGGIEVSAVAKPIKAAFLYWAVVHEGALPAAAASLNISRIFPGPVTAPEAIAGTVIGTTGSCWVLPNFTTTVLRGTVPTTIAKGPGLYAVTLNPGAGGSFDGEDPVAPGGQDFPLWQGASLVLVGKGAGRVAIYDEGLAGNRFLANPGLAYSLGLPGDVMDAGKIRWHHIGADGQKIDDVPGDQPEIADETTSINGVRVAGPRSPNHDSLWNGASAFPLTQMWDDAGFDVTAAAQARPGRRLNIKHFTAGTFVDCLIPVANVVGLF